MEPETAGPDVGIVADHHFLAFEEYEVVEAQLGAEPRFADNVDRPGAKGARRSIQAYPIQGKAPTRYAPVQATMAAMTMTPKPAPSRLAAGHAIVSEAGELTLIRQ